LKTFPENSFIYRYFIQYWMSGVKDVSLAFAWIWWITLFYPLKPIAFPQFYSFLHEFEQLFIFQLFTICLNKIFFNTIFTNFLHDMKNKAIAHENVKILQFDFSFFNSTELTITFAFLLDLRVRYAITCFYVNHSLSNSTVDQWFDERITRNVTSLHKFSASVKEY